MKTTNMQYEKDWMLRNDIRHKNDEYNRKYNHYGMSTFSEVESAYATIKPIHGKRAPEDLRPLNQRYRTWERIVKFDENTYGLFDGFQAPNGWNNKQAILDSVAILWERKLDGEYVTIRSHIGQGASVSRYNFLRNYLPRGVNFWYSSGKHYVNMNGVDYALPKSKAHWNYGNQALDIKQDNAIVLKRTADGFERVNDLLPVQTRRKGEVAKKYDPKVKEFIKWLDVMMPVFGDTIRANADGYADILSDGKSSWYWGADRYLDAKDVLAILDDEEHPKRMALAVILTMNVDAVTQGRYAPNGETYKKMRDRLRKWGNMYDVEYK